MHPFRGAVGAQRGHARADRPNRSWKRLTGRALCSGRTCTQERPPESRLGQKCPRGTLPHARLSRRARRGRELLQLDNSALIFKLLLELGGFVLRTPSLTTLPPAFDEVLGFLEAKARDGADFLDDVDLLVATRLQDDGELGLLFDGAAAAAAGAAATATAAAAETPHFSSSALASSAASRTVRLREVFNDLFEIFDIGILVLYGLKPVESYALPRGLQI